MAPVQPKQPFSKLLELQQAGIIAEVAYTDENPGPVTCNFYSCTLTIIAPLLMINKTYQRSGSSKKEAKSNAALDALEKVQNRRRKLGSPGHLNRLDYVECDYEGKGVEKARLEARMRKVRAEVEQGERTEDANIARRVRSNLLLLDEFLDPGTKKKGKEAAPIPIAEALAFDFGFDRDISAIMGESRQELLAWLNNLLSLNITKVEQCGTGAALCQVYDSIFLDIPMSRVKFNVNTEYAYIQNFKILQNAFTKHAVDRIVPVEALIKCKMQDNLEFLQWSKRYWDQYYPGGEYDALARRKGSGAPAAAAPVTRAPPAASTARRAPAGGAGAPRAAPRAGSAGAGSAQLQQENSALKETVTGLERERDFYFSKLRDIELLVQQAMEAEPELEKDENGILKQIQAILYSTEDGFEIPAEMEGGEGVEEETF